MARVFPCIGCFLRPSSFAFHTSMGMLYLNLVQTVLAQAPVNDVVSWPSGLLLLASILYAALGTSADRLWEIEPSSGIFLFSGLPQISIPLMRRVTWSANACHFVPGVRSANGVSNFWIRAENISVSVRTEALQKALALLHCVSWDIRARAVREMKFDHKIWKLSPEGFIYPASQIAYPPNIKPLISTPSIKPSPSIVIPCARDFLLFAAIEYHAFQHWVVEIRRKEVIFSTYGMPFHSIVNVDNEDDALLVVAAQMVRRPHGQSSLRSRARKIMDPHTEHLLLDLDGVDLDVPICSVDFDAYAPQRSKVSASLRELAHSYYVVLQYIERSSPRHDCDITGHIARINFGQTLWVALLGGAVLDHGRMTFLNLPSARANWKVSADYAYLTRVEAVLEQLEPVANTPIFESTITGSGGISRGTAIPFLIAGIMGQMIICYFLSVGTSAGVWTSVILANSLYSGKLHDWHTIYYGKSDSTHQPGLKLRVPDAKKDWMCVATFDRSSPKEGILRQGFLLNVFGLIAAIFGAIFQSQTRHALEFSSFTPTPSWVVYTSVALCVGTSVLIILMLVLQYISERAWTEDAMFPTRVMVYSTLSASLIVSALAVLFRVRDMPHFWPILDAVTWISGLPMGMIENGRIFSADDNILHLALLNRWMMGAVASAVGSSGKRG
ncbi:hypothetical protein DFH05DRAFT_492749 [Lentinula detonsa]|uniref:Uncharacterized protein n=1 Tax=Lentinula detonsa TaxID=2804962 RepID=A0A9W8NS34_9AGAR|nr:hypothetical protein DFH05DRAFT_492749 [Lentinula detonsa]